jgi:hypothetical protein
MSDLRNDLKDHGLQHVGWIRAGGPCTRGCRLKHEPGHLHAYIDPDLKAFVVFALLIDDQVMKFGTAGSKKSTLRDRVRGVANCGNEVWLFEEGRPVGDAGWQHSPTWDKFKQAISAVIRSGKTIEVWAGAFTALTFDLEKRELNAKYSPPWVDRLG